LGRRHFRIGRRLNLMGLRPEPLFFGSKTAAVAPTLLGCATAAGVVLTGKRPLTVFPLKRGKRKPKGGRQVREQGNSGTEPACEKVPGVVLSGPEHGEGTLACSRCFHWGTIIRMPMGKDQDPRVAHGWRNRVPRSLTGGTAGRDTEHGTCCRIRHSAGCIACSFWCFSASARACAKFFLPISGRARNGENGQAGHSDIRTTELYFVQGGRRRNGRAADPDSCAQQARRLIHGCQEPHDPLPSPPLGSGRGTPA
jgi:hypothetical protein